MRFFLILATCLRVYSQPYSQINLTWTAASNQLVNSSFQVWCGGMASFNYSSHWETTNNFFTITESMMGPGPHFISVTQISTNEVGTAMVTAFSGEVDEQTIPQMTVGVAISNAEIMVSTNLGQPGSWVDCGTNLVTVPVSGQAQVFYKSRANLYTTLVRTNVMDLLGAPGSSP